jgi:group I intron endonuclease
MSKTGFIYKITSPSNKFYIGRTINLQRRMSEHLKVSLISQEALKFGRNNMKVDILDEVRVNTKIQKESCTCCGRDKYDYDNLINIEKQYIRDFADKNMLNILDNPITGYRNK